MVTEDVIVRTAGPADATGIAAVYAPVVEQTVISFEETAPDADELARRMLARPRLPWLVGELRGRVVGFAYASQHRQRAAYRWSADCSIYLDAGARGKGLGRALYERLFAEVRELGYVSLFAGVALPNEASVGLHEALGFTPVGVYRQVGHKQGAWIDVGWWQLSLCEAPPQPAEPVESVL
ncbi:MAG: N-acetyltransferase [Pseudonocardiales bacterium]|nr:N-acetyltransferase [Pseudonocardiales bacterium]